MDLGVVIVSYNTCQLTLGCLASLYDALDDSGIDGHVWVIDNASSDDSVSAIRAHFPQATCLASPENLGFARGTNLGLEQIRELDPSPALVLLLNPDTIVDAAALSSMRDFAAMHPNVGVVGPQLCYGDGSFQHSAFRFPTLLMTFFDFWSINHRLTNSRLNGRYPRRLYHSKVPFRIDHPLGAALMVRREVLQEVGLLDPEFFMYCEEIDWCMRIKRAGWHIYCVPAAKIVHLEGQSARQFRDRMFVALWRSRYRLFQKHYGRSYCFLVRKIVGAGLRREMRHVQDEIGRRHLSQEAGAQRLAAYQQVAEM